MVLGLAVYDPALSSGRWRMLPSPTRLHRYGGIGIVGDKLYLFGGNTSASNPPDGETMVDVFDLTNEARTPDALLPPPMPTGRYGLGVVSSNGLLYTIGGGNGTEPWDPSRSVEVLEPLTGGRAELRPLSQPRTLHNAVTAGKKIVVIGGDIAGSTEWITLGTDLSACDVFEPDDDLVHANPWTIIDHATGLVKRGAKVTEARICSDFDYDHFTVFTGGSTTLTVQLTAPCDGNNFGLELLDLNGNILAVAPMTSCNDGSLTYTGSVGSQYIIRVSARTTGGYAPYTLEIL